jgi:proteasome component ECM29
MRLATDDQFLETIGFAKSIYFKSEETSHRAISGEILHSTAKLSNDRFTAFASASLPFIFVAKHDTDSEVKTIFDQTWKDNVGGNRAVILYINEILELIAAHLESPRWAIKHTAALAIANAILSFDGDIDNAVAGFIWPILEKAMAGKSWEGKDMLLKAFVRFSERAKGLWHEKTNVGDQMRVSMSRSFHRKWYCCFTLLAAHNTPYRSLQFERRSEIMLLIDPML